MAASELAEHEYHFNMHQPNPFSPRMSEEEFQEYLSICHEVYLQLLNEGTWLWGDDSQKS